MAPLTAPAESRVGPIFDPSTIRPFEPFGKEFTVFNAHDAGIKAPELKDANGALRPVADWAKGLSKDKMTAVNQVAAALYKGDGGVYGYMPYKNADDLRPSINEGLKRGGFECDVFAAIGYHALTSSGVFGKDEVYAAQVYANGGWHNVVIFKNPNTGGWDVIDYERVVSVGGKSPEEAMRKYFRNHELGVLYRVDDPNAKASVVTKVKSDHRATLDGALSRPGIDGAMNPSFGGTTGLNEGPGGRSPARSHGLGSSSSGLRMEAGPVTVDGRVTPDGLDRAGISFLTEVGSNKVAGVKSLVVRDTSGEGVNVLVGGEWWSIQKGHYFGIVGGAEARFAVGSQRMKDKGPMTTIAPLVALQGGGSYDVVGDDKTKAQWTVFTNGRVQLAAPFVVNEAAQKRVEKGSNGLSAGGVIDPAFAGLAEIKGNAGTAVRYEATPRLTLSATGTVGVELQDWTLNGWPVALSGQVETNLSYKADDVDIEAGASGGYGIYDRDTLWRAYVGAGGDVGDGFSLSSQVGAGQFMSGDVFVNGQVGARKQVGPVRLDLGLGTTVVKSPDQDPSVVPSVGLQGTF